MTPINFSRLFFALAILLFQVACAAGFPPPHPYPVVSQQINTIKVEGFDARSGLIQYPVSVVTSKASETYEIKSVEMPVMRATFIKRLEEKGVAKHYSAEGPADFTIVGKSVWAKGGVHDVTAGMIIGTYFFLPTALFPWGDAAHAKVELAVYDRDGTLLENIVEEDGIVYGMWMPLVLYDKDYKRGLQIRDVLLDRASARALEVIDRQVNKPKVANLK